MDKQNVYLKLFPSTDAQREAVAAHHDLLAKLGKSAERLTSLFAETPEARVATQTSTDLGRESTQFTFHGLEYSSVVFIIGQKWKRHPPAPQLDTATMNLLLNSRLLSPEQKRSLLCTQYPHLTKILLESSPDETSPRVSAKGGLPF